MLGVRTSTYESWGDAIQSLTRHFIAWPQSTFYLFRLISYAPSTPHLDFFFFFFWPLSLWDLSSSTRDRIWAPAVKAPSPNHWTAREFLHTWILYPSHPEAGPSPRPGHYAYKNASAISSRSATCSCYNSNPSSSSRFFQIPPRRTHLYHLLPDCLDLAHSSHPATLGLETYLSPPGASGLI